MVTLTNCGVPKSNEGFSGALRVKTDEADKDILFWGVDQHQMGPTLKYECINSLKLIIEPVS